MWPHLRCSSYLGCWFTPSADTTCWTGEGRGARTCFLSLQGGYHGHSDRQAAGYFNNIQQPSSVRVGKARTLPPYPIHPIPPRLPELVSPARGPGSHVTMKHCFAFLSQHNYLNLFIPGQRDFVAFLFTQNIVDCNVRIQMLNCLWAHNLNWTGVWKSTLIRVRATSINKQSHKARKY